MPPAYISVGVLRGHDICKLYDSILPVFDYNSIALSIQLSHTVTQGSFVRSLLPAGVQPTLDSSAETFMSAQCASPGRGGELVGVCGVCAVYVRVV